MRIVRPALGSTAFLACILAAGACSDTSEGPAAQPVPLPTVDAGLSDAEAPFPPDLPTCTDTNEALPPSVPLLTVVPDTTRFPLGWGVRGKLGLTSPNGRFGTPSEPRFNNEVSKFFSYSNDAGPEIVEAFSDLYLPGRSGVSVSASAAGGTAPGSQADLFKTYAFASEAVSTKDIYWRLSLMQSRSELFSATYTDIPGRDAPQPGDQIVWMTDSTQVFDSFLRFRFTKDNECHIKALKMIAGRRPTDPLSLKSLFDKSVRPSVERYLRERAPAAVTYVGSITTNYPLDDIKDITAAGGCKITDLDGCGAYMTKIEQAVQVHSSTTAKLREKQEDYEKGGKLPQGLIQGMIQFMEPK